MASNNFLSAATVKQEITVAVGRFRFTIPELNADSWIIALASEEPITAVIPGLLNDRDDDKLFELLATGIIQPADLRKAAFYAITKASGRKWWEALKLVGVCSGEDGPEIVGRLVLRGVVPGDMTFGAWCAAVYALCLEGHEDKERIKFKAKLASPPAIEEALEEADEGMSFDSMVRLARSMPGMRVGG